MAKEKEAKAKTKRPTALKRDIQSLRRQIANRAYRARVNTAIKDLQQAANKQEKLNSVFSLVDKGVKTGIYKQNQAARVKSRLAKGS